jgi:ribosomal protein L29
MKKKSLQEVRTKDKDKLEVEIGKVRLDIQKADIERRAGKEKNLKKVNNLKRDLAQMLTIYRETKILEKGTKGK